MDGFTPEQLNELASQAQANVQIFWNMFGLAEMPQPNINAGAVWAVMTAALEGGWVQMPGEPPLSAEEVDKEKEEAQLREDLYMAGFMHGKAKAQAELAPRRDDAEDKRLVTMTADKVGEIATQTLLSALESVADPQSHEVGGAAQLDDHPANGASADASTLSLATGTLEAVATVPRIQTAEQRQAALRAVIGDLVEMAIGNIMPTEEKWDKDKKEGMPDAEMIKMRFDLDWPTLAAYAKLELVRRGRPAKK